MVTLTRGEKKMFKKLLWNVCLFAVDKLCEGLAEYLLSDRPRKNAARVAEKIGKTLYGENSHNGQGRLK